jgi:hypothetical protein
VPPGLKDANEGGEGRERERVQTGESQHCSALRPHDQLKPKGIQNSPRLYSSKKDENFINILNTLASTNIKCQRINLTNDVCDILFFSKSSENVISH